MPNISELIFTLLSNELKSRVTKTAKEKATGIVKDWAIDEAKSYAKSYAKKKAIEYAKNQLFKETGRKDLLGRHATQIVKDSVKDSKLPRTQKGILSNKKVSSPSTCRPGHMYFFSYLPENRNELPFYDEFPVVLVLQREPSGFLGLNFHYLRHNVRANFFDALLEYTNTTNYDANPDTEIDATYKMLLTPKFQKYFRPCIKYYKFKNFTTGLYEIEPKDWKTMMFLPLEKFSKMSREEVWRWSETKD